MSTNGRIVPSPHAGKENANTLAGTVIDRPLADYAVGIDVHSQFIVVCVLIALAEKVKRKEREFPTTWSALKSAKRWTLRALEGLAGDADLRYTVESTGCYHRPILLAWEAVPSVVNPLLANPSRRKTDILDARLLANQSLSGMWPPSFIVPLQIEKLRIIQRMRATAGKTATRVSNQIGNVMLRYGHTFLSGTRLAAGDGHSIVEDLVCGRKVRHPGVSDVPMPEEVRQSLRVLLGNWNVAREQRKSFEKASLDIVRRTTWPCPQRGSLPGKELFELLRTVPGVGVHAALAWMGEIVDPARFVHPKAVAAYVGCDPSLKVSAGHVTSHTRRKGNTTLHTALVYSAGYVVRTKAGNLGEWGASIRGRHKKGGWAKAIGAVARRIAMSCYWVHTKGVPYDDSQYRFMDVPKVKSIPLANFPTLRRWLSVLTENGVIETQGLVPLFYGTKIPKVGAMCLKQAKKVLIPLVVSRSRGVFLPEQNAV